MSRRRRSTLLAAGLLAAAVGSPSVAQSPSPAAPPGVTGGVTGSGADLLAPVAGEVGVVAATVLPAADGDDARILVVVGNGTDAPVDARAAWAASDADGNLTWVGEFGGYLAVGDSFRAGEVPETIPPGGLGLFLATPADVSPDAGVSADSTYELAVVTDEPDDFGRRVDLVVGEATATDGTLAGTLTNPAEEPVEERLLVLGFCLAADGTPTGSQGMVERLEEPIAPGGSVPFSLAMGEVDCPAFLVGGVGIS